VARTGCGSKPPAAETAPRALFMGIASLRSQ
jgi:hypothetical protein